MIVIYIFVGALALTLLLAGAFRLLGVFVLQQTMGKHIDKPQDNERLVTETLQGVEHHKLNVQSGDHLLQGRHYVKTGEAVKGIVVFVYGHRLFTKDYLPEIQYLLDRGYLVYSFDPTGCGNSEGKCPLGQPQWILDTHEALNTIEQVDEWKEYPIYLLGHSTGAYAVCGVLNFVHQRVKAVVALAPINSGYEFGRVYWELHPHPSFITKQTYLAMKKHEERYFGIYSGYTALRGINRVFIPVLIVHCKDDPTIPLNCSMVRYEENMTNPRARILLLEQGGHLASRTQDGLRQEVMEAILNTFQ